MFTQGWYKITRDIPIVHPVMAELFAGQVVYCTNPRGVFTYSGLLAAWVEIRILAGDEDALVPHDPAQLALF